MKKSLTLIELLLAAAILAFVLAGILALFIGCMFLNETNRNLTTASSHAQFAMEEVKSTSFKSISSANWNSALITAKGLTPLNNETIIISASGTDPIYVAVTVNWIERNSRNRSVVLETLISEP